jgi:hypothetical protein
MQTWQQSLVRPKVLVLEKVKAGLWSEMAAKRVAAVVEIANYLLLERVTSSDSFDATARPRDRARDFAIANALAVCRPRYRLQNSLVPFRMTHPTFLALLRFLGVTSRGICE